MTNGTTIAIALGALVLVGGGVALAGAGGSRKSSKAFKVTPPTPKQSTPTPTPGGKAFPVATPPSTSGLTVGLGCTVKVYDLAKAKVTAYALGRNSPTLEQAQADLYGFGACGITERLQPPKDQMRFLHLVLFELLRGAVDGKKINKATGDALLRDSLFNIGLSGVSVAGLPAVMP